MADRKYPRILELAVKAGKWSFIAGSSAALMGMAGCEEETTNGVIALDAHTLDVIEDQGWDYDAVLGIMVEDVIDSDVPGPDIVDANQVNPDIWTAGVAPYDAGQPDVVETDPGLMGDEAIDVVFPPDDTVDPDVWLAGEAPADVAQPPEDVVDGDVPLAGGIPMEDV